MKRNDLLKNPVTAEPLLGLTLDKIEPVFKTWIRDVIADEKPSLANVFHSRRETATLLKISLPTLGKYMAQGIIHGKRAGTRILFSQEDINAALQEINRS